MLYGLLWNEVCGSEKGIQLSILTLVHAMKTQHDSHNSVRVSTCVCLPVFVCNVLRVCMCVL